MVEVENMLPRMKLSDRITWAFLIWIFFNLLWLRFVEDYIPQWVGAIIATALGAALIIFGPRPVEEIEDEEEKEEK